MAKKEPQIGNFIKLKYRDNINGEIKGFYQGKLKNDYGCYAVLRTNKGYEEIFMDSIIEWEVLDHGK